MFKTDIFDYVLKGYKIGKGVNILIISYCMSSFHSRIFKTRPTVRNGEVIAFNRVIISVGTRVNPLLITRLKN